MRKVELRMNELLKYETIKELVDHKGNKNRAAQKLGISRRQVDRLIIIYKEKGFGFVHGNRGHVPPKTLDKSISKNIILLYKNKYYDFNFNHFKKFLETKENIFVSYKYIYNTLTKEGILSPKARKKTKREYAKQKLLKEKKINLAMSEEQINTIVNHEVALEDSHPRCEKPKYFGEIIEQDGSIHVWFGGIKTCLHLAIDKATSTIVGAWFDYQETLNGYYHVLYQILTKYGYACKQLGIDLGTSSVSQAKGLIERTNGTFQGRLVQELRLENITTIEEANKYLTEVFVPEFNKEFALDYKKFPTVFETCPTEEKINYTLAVLSPRKIDNGNSIKYKNKYYQPYINNELKCFSPKTECLVIRAFNGDLLVAIDEQVLELRELSRNERFLNNFDNVVEKLEKTKYIPPMSHPWKINSFKKQMQRSHYYHKYA
mgnify:CR=1 FL=1